MSFKAPSSVSETETRSSTSSYISTASPFRLKYAKDGRGHDFSSTYKYSTSTESMESQSPKQFTRAIYEKDARGVVLDSQRSEMNDDDETMLLESRRLLIVGDDGKFRNPYDVGQRVRGLGYWSELRVSEKARSIRG
jgi:hypothetical protein